MLLRLQPLLPVTQLVVVWNLRPKLCHYMALITWFTVVKCFIILTSWLQPTYIVTPLASLITMSTGEGCSYWLIWFDYSWTWTFGAVACALLRAQSYSVGIMGPMRPIGNLQALPVTVIVGIVIYWFSLGSTALVALLCVAAIFWFSLSSLRCYLSL